MLQLIVLNSPLQGTSKDLFEGFKIGASEDADLQIEHESFVNNDFIIECNSSGIFALYSPNKKPLIISGDQNLARIDLMPGLIFSINEVGFSIQESEQLTTAEEEKDTKPESFVDLLTDLTLPEKPSSSSIFPAAQSVSFKFVRGLLLNKTWDIPWYPITFGSESSLLFFVDELIPSKLDFLNISGSDEKITISSEIPNFVSLNGEILASEPKPLSDGDLIEFGQTAFYIELK